MKEFLTVSALIYGSLFVGWALRRFRPALRDKSKQLSRFTMLGLETPAMAGIYWALEPGLLARNLRMPAVALGVFLLSGAAGYLLARLYRFDGIRTGTFTVTSMFSNIGMTLGGFLCLLYLGDGGMVLSQMYMLAGIPYYFTIVFLTARHFSPRRQRGIMGALRLNFQDPISFVPMGAILVGLCLAVCRVPFPAALALPRRVLVYATVSLFSISFGLSMQIRRMFRNPGRLLAMLPVKFLISPAAGVLLARAAGYSLAASPVAFKVVIIQASMPVAIWSVVACKLFDLDDNYAVALWIFTTLCVAVLLPLFGWLSGI